MIKPCKLQNMKNVIPVVVGFAATLALATSVRGQILQNGSFETPISTHPGGFDTFDNNTAPPSLAWKVAAGNVDLVQEGYWSPADGHQSLDLNGFLPGSIYQDVTFLGAGQYLVQFKFSGNPEGPPTVKEMRVDFGLASGPLSTLGVFTFDSSDTSTNNMVWRLESTPEFEVQGSTVYRLQFTSLQPGSYGPLIDDIRIVPEPASLALGFAAGALVFLRAVLRRSRGSQGV
jgi:choice-of-anchor C domain-containing protein